jgi:hypothetical protein
VVLGIRPVQSNPVQSSHWARRVVRPYRRRSVHAHTRRPSSRARCVRLI